MFLPFRLRHARSWPEDDPINLLAHAVAVLTVVERATRLAALRAIVWDRLPARRSVRSRQ